jgi:hypothetical protein
MKEEEEAFFIESQWPESLAIFVAILISEHTRSGWVDFINKKLTAAEI